ncbi:MAG: hypothetical protein PARBB_00504 [Parabacteroides distasonis]
MKTQEKEDLKQVENLEDQKLKAQELLEVQGGEENDGDQDGDLDDCTVFQCVWSAVTYN